MEPLRIETFNPDMIEETNSEQKRAGDINYTSVKFSYDGGKVPPLRVDGKFRLFRFKNSRREFTPYPESVMRQMKNSLKGCVKQLPANPADWFPRYMERS